MDRGGQQAPEPSSLWPILYVIAFVLGIVTLLFLLIYIPVMANETREDLGRKLNEIAHIVHKTVIGALWTAVNGDSRTLSPTHDGTTVIAYNFCIDNGEATPQNCLRQEVEQSNTDEANIADLQNRVTKDEANIKVLQTQAYNGEVAIVNLNGEVAVLQGQTQANTDAIYNLTLEVRKDELTFPQQYWSVINNGCGLSGCGPPTIVPALVSPNNSVDMTRYAVDLTLSTVIVYRYANGQVVSLSTLVLTFLNITTVVSGLEAQFISLNNTVNAALALVPSVQSVQAVDLYVSNSNVSGSPFTQVELTTGPNNVLRVFAANLVLATPQPTASNVLAAGLFSFSADMNTPGPAAFGMQKITARFNLVYPSLPISLYHIIVPCTATLPAGFYGGVTGTLSANSAPAGPFFVNTVSLLANVTFNQSPDFQVVPVQVTVELTSAPLWDFTTGTQVNPYIAVTTASPLIIGCPFALTAAPPQTPWVTE